MFEEMIDVQSSPNHSKSERFQSWQEEKTEEMKNLHCLSECSVILVGFFMTFLKLAACKISLSFLPFPLLTSISEFKSPIIITFFLLDEILS